MCESGGGEWSMAGGEEMLISVVFPAISDAAFTMKSEALKDLHSSTPSPSFFIFL